MDWSYQILINLITLIKSPGLSVEVRRSKTLGEFVLLLLLPFLELPLHGGSYICKHKTHTVPVTLSDSLICGRLNTPIYPMNCLNSTLELSG